MFKVRKMIVKLAAGKVLAGGQGTDPRGTNRSYRLDDVNVFGLPHLTLTLFPFTK